MSQKSNSILEQAKLQQLSTLHKIIRLDEKNNNYNLFIDFDIKLKNTLINTPSKMFVNQKDYGLKLYWRHINNHYFKQMEAGDIEKLELLCLKSRIPMKDTKQHYSNNSSYHAFKKLIPYPPTIYEPQIKFNSSNLRKHYLISTELSPLTNKEIEKEDFEDVYEVLHNKYEVCDDGEINKFLENEKRTLDRLVSCIESGRGDHSLNNEILKMENELAKQRTENFKILEKLKKNALYDLALPPVNNDMILEYAAQLINKIEKCIIADSVNRITGIEENGDELNFKVHFENFYATKTSSIPEDFMGELDKLREVSLFSPQTIAQKTPYSFTCPNFIGFERIITQHNKIHPVKKGENLFKAFKRKNLSQKYSKNMANFYVCHHCKYYYHEKFLIKCNYDSACMGLPILTNLDESEITTNQKKRILSGQRKRDEVEGYERNFKELICLKMFCRNCLKSNYDIQIQEILPNKNWICPFCQGICYCSKCLGMDMINKIKRFYIQNGGNLNDLENKTILPLYIPSNHEEKSNCCNNNNNNINLNVCHPLILDKKSKKIRKTFGYDNVINITKLIRQNEQILNEKLSTSKFFEEEKKVFPESEVTKKKKGRPRKILVENPNQPH